jgi:hypothetical protein
MGLIEQCRTELLAHGHGRWTGRDVDLALLTHGQHRGLPRPKPWRRGKNYRSRRVRQFRLSAMSWMAWPAGWAGEQWQEEVVSDSAEHVVGDRRSVNQEVVVH